MMRANPSQSAFVPHDLNAPLNGSDEGPFAGLKVAVKDMYDIAGERVSGGSPSWHAEQPVALAHSAVVEQLLRAGATITHKTVCDEFFYSITGTNFHYGTPLNPKAPDRIPGGSSSGSASACASGACDIAIGSDTGGSVRVPAALCGLFGIRTTRGRMDLRGAMRMSPSFDAGGWFAPSAELFAMPAPVLLKGWNAYAETPRRVLVLTDMFAIADRDIEDLCRDFLGRVEPALPWMEEVDLARGRIDTWRDALRVTQAHEVWQSFGSFITQHKPHFGPGVAERMQIAAAVTDDDVARCKPVLSEATARLEELTASGTILVLPTCPAPAPSLGSAGETLEQFRVRTMRMVCSCSISGLPQITLPIGSVGGSPTGLSIIGWRHGEEALLNLAKELLPEAGVQ
jgi:amidase